MNFKLNIEGMSCNGCVKNISKMMNEFDSVQHVNIDLHNKSGLISTTSGFNSDEFINRFDGTKFNVQILNGQTKQKKSLRLKIKNLI